MESSNFEGEPVVTQQMVNPIRKTAAGQHEFAPGVKLEDFSAVFETKFTPTVSEEIVFKGGAAGFFEIIVNGDTLTSYTNWRTIPARFPFTVKAGKTYDIEIRYAQRENWEANIEVDFGREENVDYTDLLKKLEGIETVVFAGGLSGSLEGEEMPVSYPGFKGGDRTHIELPSVQRNALKALKEAGKTVIFVNFSGSAIALEPETESCDAILQAGMPANLVDKPLLMYFLAITTRQENCRLLSTAILITWETLKITPWKAELTVTPTTISSPLVSGSVIPISKLVTQN